VNQKKKGEKKVTGGVRAVDRQQNVSRGIIGGKRRKGGGGFAGRREG